jgi:ubiquinone/menaquinone biosynthesis C-methylase UbiE
LDTFPQVELTAIDLDPKAEPHFAALQETYGQRLTFRQADMLDLPFDRNSFDIVLALNVLHRIEDQRLALRQFLRVLKEGGLIGIVGRRPEPEVVEALLREEGTDVVRSEGRAHYYLWAREPYTDGRQTVVY